MSTAGAEDPRRPGVRNADSGTTAAAGTAGLSHQIQQRAKLGQLLDAGRQIHAIDQLLVSGFRSSPNRPAAPHPNTTTSRNINVQLAYDRRGRKSPTTSL
ncbi:hypothetical protein [Herbaspirillum sp. RV1423]|uniref:hypothetical protein n=1 Tax=Herbaspirillum sp. RV1423 TaxID=1443993 RepID=UPI000551E2CA|nr:hypothetical protein [Herbaspirillum sp. RV1423]